MLFIEQRRRCIIDSLDQPFDLLEFQQKARETLCPKKLFLIWEDVCRRYERHEIGLYQLEEMKEVIGPHLAALSALRKIIDGTESKRQKHPGLTA
jgi:hypothetical protein